MPLLDESRSHWVPGADDSPPLRDLTVGAVLDEAAQAWPDREALVYSAYDDLGITARWSFAEPGIGSK